MNAINRLVSLFLLLIALIFGAWFGWDNQTPLMLHVFGYDLPSVSAGVAILMALAMGVVLGLGVAQFSLYRLRIKNRQLKKQLKRATSFPVTGD
ncbi:LapA family protein [Simiduia sp. 21SJ11W-1]|uniref:LapA family protein n=1 Tax=Simiduia sp. 21SJ11W-1 TaxID=2909669 RepID=UPI00209ED9B7|nr:LapA family protein [Simiduia sp. 21SJ11W-1]UTA49528.1 LapA family protein [Simiduia sp. 21SJ11W-1]